MREPVRMRAVIEFDSYDPNGSLTGMATDERIRQCVETHPTLSLKVENVSVTTDQPTKYAVARVDDAFTRYRPLYRLLSRHGDVWILGRVFDDKPAARAFVDMMNARFGGVEPFPGRPWWRRAGNGWKRMDGLRYDVLPGSQPVDLALADLDRTVPMGEVSGG